MADASIDRLSIEIEANADKATAAIQKLTSRLTGLNLALNRINTKNITSFAKSMESLSTIGRRTDETSRAVEKFATTLAQSFGIRSKEGIDSVKEAMLELTDANRKFEQSNGRMNFGEKLEAAKKVATDTVKEYAKIPQELDRATQSVLDYVKATNSGKSKVSLADMAQEFGDNFAHMRAVLGKNFTSQLKSTQEGVVDLEAYLRDLNETTKSSFDTDNVSNGFKQLVDVVERGRNAYLSYSEAVAEGSIREDKAKYAVLDYVNAIDKLIRSEEDLKKNNGIDAIVNSLRGLSDVQVPDFSSFAQAIEALNRASTDKVVRNIKAVKQALDETVPSAEDVQRSLQGLTNVSTDALGNATSFVSDIFENQLLPAIRECTSLVPSMANGFKEIVPVTNSVNEIIVVMNGELARAGYYIEDMKTKMSQLLGIMGKSTSVPLLEDFRNFNPDIIDAPYKEIIEMGSAAEESIKEFGNTTNSIFDNIKSKWESIFGKAFPDQVQILDDVNGKLVPIDTTMKDAASSATSLTSKFASLATIIEKISEVSDKLGNIGIKVLKTMYIPLQNLVEEYKEKAKNIADAFGNMRKKVESHFKAMSKTWQRIARTFTFMLVRKAITAMIKDVKEAVDELALFEKNLGTLSNGKFNASLSQITSDFHYIGRAIVAAFEPLINYVVPALNAVASAIANVLSLVGEFFAAFTGQDYFVKAKKTVVDYGKELEKDNKKLKEQKKLLLKIDEINNLPSQNDSSSSSSGSGINYKDAFDEKPVSDKMKNLAAKIKDILSKLFDPLRKAWDNVGDYVLRGFRYLGSQIKRLATDIGKDFLTMWNEPETQRILESILRTVGHLAFGLGNLVSNFADAWEIYGLGILEKIRDNIGILQGWVEKTALAFKNWTKDVKFDNLLSAIDQLLIKTQALSNFIGGVFYDVMTKVVMKYVEFMVEEGLPHLITTIGEVIDAFDFEKIRGDLQILEVAFEHMAEQIDIGITNAIGNVGKQLAEWMNSDEFTKFCEALAHFMDLVTAERVEKLFTALGTALLNVGKALADFISSDAFKSFVDKLVEWYDSKSAEEIAKYIEDIAKAILIFKFVAFVGPGIAGFFKFIATIKTLSNLSTIAKGITAVGTATSTAGTAIGTAGTTAAAGLGTVAAGAAGLTAGGVSIVSSLNQMKNATETYATANTTHSKEVESALENLKKLYEKSPEMAAEWAKTVYDIDISNDSLYEAQNKVWKKIDQEWEDVPQNLFEGLKGGWNDYFGQDGKGLLAYTSDAFTQWVQGIKDLLGIASPSTVFEEIGGYTTEGFENGFTTGWTTVTTDVLALVGQLITDIGTKFSEIGTGISDKLTPIKTAFETKFGEVKTTVESKIGDAAKAVSTKCGEITKNSKTKLNEFKNTVGEKFKEAKDKINDKMKDSLEVVRDKLSQMKDKFQKFDLTKMGTNVIKGFLSGLKGAWADVKAWAAQAVADIKSKFAEALQIKSPSRVFMKYGEYTVEGYNIGLEKASLSTSDSVDKWVSSFKDMSVTLAPDITTKSSDGIVKDLLTGGSISSSDSSEFKTVIDNAVSRLIASQNSRNINVTVDLDGRRVYEAVVRQDKQQILRAGKSSFAY